MQRRELFLRMAQGEILKQESKDLNYFNLGQKNSERDDISIYEIEMLVNEKLIKIVNINGELIGQLTAACNLWFKNHNLNARIVESRSDTTLKYYFLKKNKLNHAKKEWLFEEIN